MKRFTLRFVVILCIDVLLLLFCLLHLPSVFNRPAAPFEVGGSLNNVTVIRIHEAAMSGGLHEGDRLVEWEDQAVEIPEVVEFLADMAVIGDLKTLTYEREGVQQSGTVTIMPFYASPRFMIISLVVGLVVWSIAVFILWSAPPGVTGAVLHWTMIAFAVTILITLGAISPDNFMSYVDRALFFAAYEGVVALFFYFTLLYPTPKVRSKIAAPFLTFVPAVLLVGGLSILQLADLSSASTTYFREFQFLFDVFHVSLFLYVGGAVFCILVAFRNALTGEDRKRMQWIVWGLCIGAVPFLSLHVLPQLLFSVYLIPEEYATIFFLAVPFSFSISFLKYHLLDIELLISRSIVYTILSGFVIVAFILMFVLATTAFEMSLNIKEYLLVAGVSVFMALLFVPAREKIQHVIDDALFAVRANFRAALVTLTERLHHSLTPADVYRTCVDEIAKLIPTRAIAFYTVEDGSLRFRGGRGEEMPEWIVFPHEALGGDQTRVWAAPDAVIMKHGINFSHSRWMKETGFSVCVTLTNDAGGISGALMLSPRIEGDKFREEEIDLLTTACSHASDVLERLKLQGRMFLESEERLRLQELSDLKSYFVSSVSHELRIPLTSIRMFAETLRLGRVSGARRKKEYLRIIEGESERLGRLIGNVLDFAKIEKGVKSYEFQPTDVGRVAARAAKSLRYEFRSAKGRLAVNIGRRLPRIRADADSLLEMILNLLSNALKYSTGRKYARLTVKRSGLFLVVEVSDNGIGISHEEIPRIFEKFYRARDFHAQQVGGTGLGLPLAKHIVEAHGGTISVRSIKGKGSTFTVKLPIHENNTPR